MAWRFDKVAYTGDVRKMFSQVLIHPDDQVFHRLLWRTNESLKPKVYQWRSLNFGDKPAPDIAAGAIITLAKAFQDQYPEAAKELQTHVYVDDIGASRENEDKSKTHRLVELLLEHLHEKRAHCGYTSLVYESRKRFWIVGVRYMAKHLTEKCVTCKKLRKQPLQQLMGQIPKLRVATGFPAFSNTAIDMFDPLQIRLGRKTLKKAHVVIFTCMTTKAVHLELVTDRSTDTFLMAFRRFVLRTT